MLHTRRRDIPGFDRGTRYREGRLAPGIPARSPNRIRQADTGIPADTTVHCGLPAHTPAGSGPWTGRRQGIANDAEPTDTPAAAHQPMLPEFALLVPAHTSANASKCSWPAPTPTTTPELNPVPIQGIDPGCRVWRFRVGTRNRHSPFALNPAGNGGYAGRSSVHSAVILAPGESATLFSPPSMSTNTDVPLTLPVTGSTTKRWPSGSSRPWPPG